MFYLLHFWCSTLHLMKSAQHCLYNSGIKVDILDTCGAMICSYFGIAFLLFFIKIENAVYTSCQNSTLLFINGLIFDIVNTQNNQSLEFEWKPTNNVRPLMINVNDRRFLWLRNESFQDWLNFVQQCQGNFTRCRPQKVHIVANIWRLKISVNSITEATQFLLWHQVKYALAERFCQDPLKNWCGRLRSLGSWKDNPSMADFGYS